MTIGTIILGCRVLMVAEITIKVGAVMRRGMILRTPEALRKEKLR
ncbi:MAG: hypothetical protein R6U13_03180 [Desulfatiglandaceae bacterium]